MLKFFNKFEEYLLLFLFPLMVCVVFIATVARYFDLFPMFWGEELARYIMIYLAYIAAGLAMKHGAHVGVSFLVDKIKSKKIRFGFDIFRIVAILFFTSTIVFMISEIIISQIKIGQTSPALFMPIWVMYAAVPFGMILVSVRAIQSFLQIFKQYKQETKTWD